MEVLAVIYIILAVITIFLFILTRPMNLRIAKADAVRVNVEFTLVAMEFTKSADSENKKNEDTAESESGIDIGAILSLFAKVFGYLKRCGIRIHRLVIPKKDGFSSFWTYFRYMRLISVIFAYIDSKVESLIIEDNAFILSSDTEKVEFDVTFKTVPLDLIILAVRLIFEIIKLRKMEKNNVRN